ncbi:MAG TPA: hypothetical protein VGD58_09665 [Herpetosiphonaceae bacterium]
MATGLHHTDSEIEDAFSDVEDHSMSTPDNTSESFAGSSNPSLQAQFPTNTRISVDDFTEAVFSSVLRALQTQKIPLGPIIYGIWFDPRGDIRQPGQVIGPGATGLEDSSRS